jgi:hypothetical protein
MYACVTKNTALRLTFRTLSYASSVTSQKGAFTSHRFNHLVGFVLISTVHDGDVDAVAGEAFSNGSADALVSSGDDGRPRHVQRQLQPSGLDRLEEQASNDRCEGGRAPNPTPCG